MGKKLGPGLVAGVALWGVLSVACSAVADRPARTRGWSGDVAAREEPRLSGDPLALDWAQPEDTHTLARLDPRTLRTSHEFPLGVQATRMWDVSPDGRSVLLVTSKGQLRVVGLAPMRDRLREPLGVSRVMAATWVADDVAIVVVVAGQGDTQLVRFAPSTGAILDRESVDADAFATVAAEDGIVLLAHEAWREGMTEPGPTTLAVMDASGHFAERRIAEVRSGFFDEDGGYSTRWSPALAVRDSQATLVGTDGTIASVDLTDLSVRVEGVSPSFFDGLAAWFVAPAHAKLLDATELRAEWISPDELLVAGYRTETPDDPDEDPVSEPSGAVVVDATDWSTSLVDEEASAARMAGDVLVTWREQLTGDERHDGIGLRGYTGDGELAWQVLDRQFVRMLAVHEGVAFVQHGWHRVLTSSVDVRTGRVLSTRELSVEMMGL